MRKTPYTLALVLSLGGAHGILVSCATTQTPRAQVGDARLAMHVGRRLAADPQVRRFEIDVDAREGMVILRGVVDSSVERTEAERVAERTPGVVGVENHIQLESEIGEGERSDFVVRVKIGTQLSADPDVRRTDIDIDVEEGIVYLSGVVYDEIARTEAERLARSVDGVREVHNELEVAVR